MLDCVDETLFATSTGTGGTAFGAGGGGTDGGGVRGGSLVPFAREKVLGLRSELGRLACVSGTVTLIVRASCTCKSRTIDSCFVRSPSRVSLWSFVFCRSLCASPRSERCRSSSWANDSRLDTSSRRAFSWSARTRSSSARNFWSSAWKPSLSLRDVYNLRSRLSKPLSFSRRATSCIRKAESNLSECSSSSTFCDAISCDKSCRSFSNV